MTEPTFTITAREFRDLVSPVIPLADKDGALPALNAVRIQSRGSYLVASATDRFRLGFNRINLSEPVEGIDISVRLAGLRQILSIFKSTRQQNPEIKFVVTEAGLRVEQGGGFGFVDASMTFEVADTSKLPNLATFISKWKAGDSVHPISVNAEYLSSFRDVVKRGEPMVIVPGMTGADAITVRIGADFIGVLMPVVESRKDGLESIEEWQDFLTDGPESQYAGKSKVA